MSDREFPLSQPDAASSTPPFRVPEGAPAGTLPRGSFPPATEDEAHSVESDSAQIAASDSNGSAQTSTHETETEALEAADFAASDERSWQAPDDEMARFAAVEGNNRSDQNGDSQWQSPLPFEEDLSIYNGVDSEAASEEEAEYSSEEEEDWPENRPPNAPAPDPQALIDAEIAALDPALNDVVPYEDIESDIAPPASTSEPDDVGHYHLAPDEFETAAPLAMTSSASVVPPPDEPHVPSPYDDENAPRNDRELGLIEHLGELRTRILWCVGAVMVAMMGTWYFTPQIQILIIRPVKSILARYSIKGAITTTEPTEAFMVYFNISLISALIVVMPFLLFQMWRFIEPAMTNRERRFTGILVPFSVLLFFMGCALGYAVSPLFFTFFAQFQPPGTLAMYSFASVAVLLVKMLLVFGITFQVPIITIFLNKAGLVSRNLLIEYWRHVIVVIFTVVAILTPTWDPITLVVCSTPPCLLYVLSIWLVKWL